MATLYITEYVTASVDQGRAMPIAFGPPITSQTVAIGGASVSSAAFNANTRLIRVHTDAICSIAIAVSPTATTSTARMAANQTEYFGVDNSLKIAVITNV